jgi:hypothetical protein
VQARGEECKGTEAKKVGNRAKTQYNGSYPPQLKAVLSRSDNMGHGYCKTTLHAHCALSNLVMSKCVSYLHFFIQSVNFEIIGKYECM